MSELLRNAFTGVNLIPTILLIIILLYWVSLIFGAMDFDFLDFDLEIGNGAGPAQGLLAFLNVRELPFMLVLSILILSFWINSMLIYYLPIKPGGWLNAILLIPAIIVSVFVTRYVSMPLKSLFKDKGLENKESTWYMEKECILKVNLEKNRLGQAEIKREGASIVLNVKSEFQNIIFSKGEVAIIIRKDSDKNIYYLVKTEEEKKCLT